MGSLFLSQTLLSDLVYLAFCSGEALETEEGFYMLYVPDVQSTVPKHTKAVT